MNYCNRRKENNSILIINRNKMHLQNGFKSVYVEDQKTTKSITVRQQFPYSKHVEKNCNVK